jgi:hypothetical protein
MLDYKHEVLEAWPEGVVRTPADKRKNSPFKAQWDETLLLLARQLQQMEAHPSCTRIKTFHRHAVVRRDGMLRSDAPAPDNPGVILSFEVFKASGKRNERGQRLGKYVPVQFECDRFTHWKDNVRAIALALEALRKVERYGVARASVSEVGRQQALPPTYIPAQGMTVDDAWAILAHFSKFTVEELMGVGARIKDAYRQAMKHTHPDQGGNQDDAAKVNVAYEVLKAHLGISG